MSNPGFVRLHARESEKTRAARKDFVHAIHYSLPTTEGAKSGGDVLIAEVPRDQSSSARLFR